MQEESYTVPEDSLLKSLRRWTSSEQKTDDCFHTDTKTSYLKYRNISNHTHLTANYSCKRGKDFQNYSWKLMG